jgi:hypothetical protein
VSGSSRQKDAHGVSELRMHVALVNCSPPNVTAVDQIKLCNALPIRSCRPVMNELQDIRELKTGLQQSSLMQCGSLNSYLSERLLPFKWGSEKGYLRLLGSGLGDVTGVGVGVMVTV